MKWMECRATRREIDQVEGSERLSAQALRHIAACPACGVFQNERARLRELLTSLEPVTAPADFDFRLRARIAAQKESVGPRSFFSGFALSTPVIAVVAVVVVLGGSIVWMAQHGINPSSTVASNPPGQGSQGNSTAIDNSAPPIKKANGPGSTSDTLTTGANTSADEPAYLVRGGKPQFKGPGSAQPLHTRDLNAGSAPSIKQGQNTGDVSVNAPVKPMVLSFQDDNGATRTFSLPPVSFGSQRLLESRVVPVSSKNARVW
jgi:hypothetical protein